MEGESQSLSAGMLKRLAKFIQIYDYEMSDDLSLLFTPNVDCYNDTFLGGVVCPGVKIQLSF